VCDEIIEGALEGNIVGSFNGLAKDKLGVTDGFRVRINVGLIWGFSEDFWDDGTFISGRKEGDTVGVNNGEDDGWLNGDVWSEGVKVGSLLEVIKCITEGDCNGPRDGISDGSSVGIQTGASLVRYLLGL
jgi:hypothetical protein